MLHPGDDGTLPVSVRWSSEFDAPEAFGIDDGVVYVASDEVYALRLSDGHELWGAGDPNGPEALHASGGVEIGLDAEGRLRVDAPYEYLIVVDRDTGRVECFGLGNCPGELRPFPARVPERWQVEMDLEEIVARDDRGVAWRITVESPTFDERGPVGIPGGLVLTTSSGHLVVLDDRQEGQ